MTEDHPKARALWTRQLPSPLGMLVLCSDGEALTGLRFRDPDWSGSVSSNPVRISDPPVLQQTEAWLDQYFRGRIPDFTPPLRPAGTAFQQQVWALLLEIPWGQTVTYGQLAADLAARRGLPRMAAQAVGGAVGRNPIDLIIPCHRVIGADGSLVGYAEGLDRKAWLLAHEASK